MMTVCVVVTRRDFWHRDSSVTSVTCLTFTTPTTVHSKACRQVLPRHIITAVAMTTGRTAPLVKVCHVCGQFDSGVARCSGIAQLQGAA